MNLYGYRGRKLSYWHRAIVLIGLVIGDRSIIASGSVVKEVKFYLHFHLWWEFLLNESKVYPKLLSEHTAWAEKYYQLD